MGGRGESQTRRGKRDVVSRLQNSRVGLESFGVMKTNYRQKKHLEFVRLPCPAWVNNKGKT